MESKIKKHTTKNKWYKDGHDWIINIGNMQKSIVVAYYLGGKYAISPRSFFPFNDEQCDKKFDNHEDCKKYAESIFIDWAKSVMEFSENSSIQID